MERDIVLRGSRFDVERVILEGKDGSRVPREFIRHPGAVVLVPVLDDGRIVLIRNRRFTVDETLWELPAGTREPGEEAIVTAHRELEEETGYVAETLTPLLDFFIAPGTSDELMCGFVATGLRETAQKLDATEDISVQPVTRERFMELVRAGEIRDGKTLALGLLHLAEAP